MPTEKTAHGHSILLSFAPYESHLLRYTPSLVAQSAEHPQEDAPAQEKSWVLPLDIEQPWKLTALQDNILRFATFRFALDQNNIGSSSRWYEGQIAQDWPLVEAKALINQCADLATGQTFPLQFKQSFGSPMHSSLAYPLRCWYQTTFSVTHLPLTCKLIMDRDAIGGNYTLYLNGHKITAQDFAPISAHGYPQLGCEVQQLLKPGTNYLVVHVEAQSAADGVRDPLYLSGPFGLSLDATGTPTIGKVPQTGRLQSGTLEGYPYFAGTLSFTKDISIETLPHTKTFVLAFQGWDPHIHDCVEILINGHSLGVCCWSPYHWEGESAILHARMNTVEIRLTNTLSGMLEGSYFDDASHQIIPITKNE